ncbi:unnamed protein product [Rhizoctonia solani]|uniref:Laminin domain protein n=1 Tax=Rhizoctonia solani TaxID=456999 RepID=A0A8H3I6W5_9AGAM|nr:unnamed protein product [Rhizoctonia solani]
MTPIRVSRAGEIVLTPPQLPPYLASMHELKPIVGKPVGEDVKVIHAVIRALNAVNHLPAFYNPDLSMQLSQHLFGAQMAIFKASYSMSLMPGDKSIFTPPDLPSHIPGKLDKISGAPSDEEIMSVQSVVRSVDNLATSPQLFDADLSMKLSQHMFNLQFARYIHDSSEGHFVSETGTEAPRPVVSQLTQGTQPLNMLQEAFGVQREGRNGSPAQEVEQDPGAPSELTQLGDIAKTIKDAAIGSKDILQSMNRTLTLMKNDQSTVGCMSDCYHIFKNPLNHKGILASDSGLPHLRYWWYNQTGKFKLWLNHDDVARYLEFFGIGADLIRGGEEPKLIDGKYDEAEELLLKQVGIYYC